MSEHDDSLSPKVVEFCSPLPEAASGRPGLRMPLRVHQRTDDDDGEDGSGRYLRVGNLLPGKANTTTSRGGSATREINCQPPASNSWAHFQIRNGHTNFRSAGIDVFAGRLRIPERLFHELGRGKSHR